MTATATETMCSSSTTTTRRRQQHHLTVDMPFIIESFPAPPTHIPSPLPSPGGMFNPPLSRPPSLPLPPLPGPSPIQDQESLAALFSSRNNSPHRRISIVSTSSSASEAYVSAPIPRHPPTTPATGGAIQEEDDESAYTGIVVDSDDPGANPVLDTPLAPEPFCRPPSPPMDESELTLNLSQKVAPDPDDSISSISMDDLPPPDDDAEPDAALQVHLHMRATRSTSAAHKRRLLLSSTSMTMPTPPSPPRTPPPPLMTPSLSSPPALESTTFPVFRPRSPPHFPPPAGRAPSPDIAAILTRTPRPSLRSKRSASDGHLWKRTYSTRRKSSARRSCRSAARDTWDEDGFLDVYASSRQSVHTFGGDHANDDDDDELMSEPEDGGDDDSDSSLDLHTPLTRLLLRDGVLSPNSKLLPDSSRPGSMISVVSGITKSGFVKDARNTPQRRSRHRDGKTLRGGLGLTTGLGWSDSEDEHAPSAFTRKITTNLVRSTSSLSRSTSSVMTTTNRAATWSSSMLSRSSSASSLRLAFPSSISRDTLLEETHEEADTSSYYDDDDDVMRTTKPPLRTANVSTTVKSPSSTASASTSSIATPDDEDYDRILAPTTTGGANLRRDKTLPPLPPPSNDGHGERSIRKQASTSVLGYGRPSVGRDRKSSIASSTGSVASKRSSTAASSSNPPSVRSMPPRALKLPQSRLNGLRSAPADRPPVPVPGIGASTPSSRAIRAPSYSFSSNSVSTGPPSRLRTPSSSTSLASLSTASSSHPNLSHLSTPATLGRRSLGTSSSGIPSMPTTPITPTIKPRIGTGMVYRKSSANAYTPPPAATRF